jgi:hypothetical protein
MCVSCSEGVQHRWRELCQLYWGCAAQIEGTLCQLYWGSATQIEGTLFQLYCGSAAQIEGNVSVVLSVSSTSRGKCVSFVLSLCSTDRGKRVLVVLMVWAQWGKCVPFILMVSRKSRGKCVPVLLNFNSPNKRNCTECYHRHHLSAPGVIAASLAKHCVVLWKSCCTQLCEWHCTVMLFVSQIRLGFVCKQHKRRLKVQVEIILDFKLFHRILNVVCFLLGNSPGNYPEERIEHTEIIFWNAMVVNILENIRFARDQIIKMLH